MANNHQEPQIIWGRDRKIWIAVRQGLLLIVDAIEVYLEYEKRTSELRRIFYNKN
jgi:hypothetical protein